MKKIVRKSFFYPLPKKSNDPSFIILLPANSYRPVGVTLSLPMMSNDMSLNSHCLSPYIALHHVLF